jgi:chitin-binding protein
VNTPIKSIAVTGLLLLSSVAVGHGTAIEPMSRVYRVFQSNPENPNFALAAAAVALDGTQSYYTWNELSRNIPDAVNAGLPPGFDYSPWLPDGQIASGGRVDSDSTQYPRTYAGLDQVSAAWPTTPVQAGAVIEVDFLGTTPHQPSVWDVWMTMPDWQPDMPLAWNQLEFLGRPEVVLQNGHFTFDQLVPADRSGHHVLFIAWHRDDPVGEVFFSASDLDIEPAATPGDITGDGVVGVHDLLELINAWGPCNAGGACPADLDGDGLVTVVDLLQVLEYWTS